MTTPCRFMSVKQWICYLYSLIQEIEVNDIWKGRFPDYADLSAALPIGEQAWFAFLESTNSYWFWSSSLGQWVNQDITEAQYMGLTLDDKSCVPYIIVP